MKKSRLSLILFIVTLSLLWWQARQAIWNTHLQVDIWVQWERLSYWLSHGRSFAGLMGNEILPATLLYVFTPIALIPIGWLSYQSYLPAMLLINLIIIVLHWVLVENKNIFLLSLLFLGPILLFRFDALVTLMVILAFVSFEDKKYLQSGFWLGIATGMKVYPVIFLPYLAIILMKQKRSKELLRLIICFLEALLIPAIIFVMLGGNLDQIGSMLAFHNQKLISIESLPGSLITGWSLLVAGIPPQMLPGNGIWSVAGPAALFNRLWMVPVLFVYWGVWRDRRLIEKFSWAVPSCLIMVFLIFSKNLNPQYLWWFMAFLPFVKADKWIWGLTLSSALLNQLVFPLFYTTFTNNFYLYNQSYWIYFLLLLRNLCLVAVAYLSINNLLFNSATKRVQNE